MKAVTCIAILFLASLNWGCGGGASGSHSQSPATPSTPSTPTTPKTPSVSSLAITPVSMSIGMGSTQQFVATAQLSDGTTKDMSSSVAWSSSDASVASISGSGLASGAAAGSVTISAQSGTVHGSATLAVTAAAVNLKSIKISPAASPRPLNASQHFPRTA